MMRILAVDDDPVFREILESYMDRLGYPDVTYAMSGPEALKSIQAAPQPFDCFLCDIEMPGMNGIELVRNIRSTESGKRAPVVMITSMGDRDSVDGAFQAGAIDYLSKPLDINQLRGRLSAVERIVRESRRFESMKAMLRDHDAIEQGMRDFDEPVALNDVDGVMHYVAVKNYLETVGRLRMMNHAAMCIHIRNAEKLFGLMTRTAFMDMLGDVAETAHGELQTMHHMFAHAGSGDFVVLLPRLAAIDPGELEALINVALEQFYDQLDEPDVMRPVVTCGPVVRPALLQLGDPASMLEKARSLAQFPLPHKTQAKSILQTARA